MHIFQSDCRSCLVNQVNCLIRQITIVNISFRKLNCSHNRFIGNFHLMMLFIFGRDSPKDLNGLFYRGLLHMNSLESPLKCCILFHIFMIFRYRSGTNELKFSSCQRRLQNVGGIDCALCTSCPDDRMHFVQEKNDIAIFLNLTNHLFDSFLKLTTIFRACHHSGQIQCEKPLILDRKRYLSGHNAGCKALNNSCFPNSGFSDQTGIVLCSPA